MNDRERGCYVMEGVIYTSFEDGSENARAATPEEVLMSDSLQLMRDARAVAEDRAYYNGARAAAQRAHAFGLQAMDEWITGLHAKLLRETREAL